MIQSISGIRGTLGGRPGEGLSPVDILAFATAYGMWLKDRNREQQSKVVIGRDGRVSGPLISQIVSGGLRALGIDVIDAGLSTTPTVEMGVIERKAQGGVIITASHNPANWNALKLLNELGEFMTAAQGKQMQQWMDPGRLEFETAANFGKYTSDDGLLSLHIERILELPLVDADAIRSAGFAVAVDGINSSGGVAVPCLLDALGVSSILPLHCEPDGLFRHDPEPLPENLQQLSEVVVNGNAHLGLAVDPDVDRLAIVCEDGEMFGEEYTLVAVADYVLSHTPGNTVSNLSSTRALAGVSRAHGGKHSYSAVGEVNVVEVMKQQKAVIGGEGNGGVIYPTLHYGRDALVGIALFLTHLAKSGLSCSRLRNKYPRDHLSKNKIRLPANADLADMIEALGRRYSGFPSDRTDGLKIWFAEDWVHIRPSNTEAIIRLYAESDSQSRADHLAGKIGRDINEILKGM